VILNAGEVVVKISEPMGKPPVIDAHQMQDCGVEIAHVRPVDCRVQLKSSVAP